MAENDAQSGEGDDVAGRLMGKLRSFTQDLEADEKAMFAALIGPGVELAHTEAEEVAGFGVSWEAGRLPQHLAEEIVDKDIRISGL